ncbi:MAG: hypothetical protein A2622_05710 [Bdellovibrionales bacterium RIFCSPHIGHO2_01_FULL_40_29]|nr:MAG: hypothetical protein A2622_05710 [Bdellovibrionales bacterium RIFCSPHIGHO2_01_FULL_40_29]OFZ34952.1 MAG: hypothetical protein A3D17_06060 [Bdellovibrionales bacterium RIFCSPHIGHO2_02_FULL_40_15]
MGNNFFSVIVAGIYFSMTAFAYSPAPVHPGYSSCPIVDIPGPGHTAEAPVYVKGPSPSCISSIDRKHEAATNSHYIAQDMFRGGYDGKTPPAQPVLATCGTSDNGNGSQIENSACANSNYKKQAEYSRQKQIYDFIQTEKAKTETVKAESLRSARNGSSTETLAEIEATNLDMAGKQKDKQGQFMMTSTILAGAYAASCSGGCYTPLLYASIGAGIMGMLSGKQASNHMESAGLACQSYNRIASAGKICGEAVPFNASDLNNPVFPNEQINPITGQCKPNAPATCTVERQRFLDRNGGNLNALKPGPSGFGGAGNQYKFNSDGTVTTKDGKKFSAADFADEKSMIAAGLSPAEAAETFKALYGKNGVVAKIGPIKDELIKASNFGSSGANGGGGTMTIKLGEESSNSEDLGIKNMADSNKRKLASDEGLVRNFNGDHIGIANDDIFRMMKRRYNLKTAQDTFISP